MWVRSLDWEDSPWSRKWQPTLVFLPGKFHGQRSQVGYSPWGHKESDTSEQLSPRTHDFRQLILLNLCFFYFNFLAVPLGIQDLSSLTRDRSHAPCIGSAES